MTNVLLDLIEAGDRLRGTSPEQVAALAASMAEVGLISPISVAPFEVIRAGIAVSGYRLIAGLHRLEAARSLGWREIPAHVVSLSDLQQQLAECDENLCGTKLTPSERALFTARRKAIYEALHPETRNGASGNGREKVRQVGEATSERFTADTAARTGRSERDVQRDAARGSRIRDDVLAEIKGTNLDRGVVLDALAKAEDQDAELRRLRAERDADEARKANRETDRIIAEQRLERVAEFLTDRLGIQDVHTLGEMLAGIFDPLSRALLREVV